MRSFVKLGLSAAAVLIAGAATAATVTTTFQSKIVITAQCLVNATLLDFGSSGVIAANIDATSTINVQCTNTTAYSIGLSKGANGASVTNRLMKGSGIETVAYSLYTTAGRTTNWDDTGGTTVVSGTGNGASQAITVFGRVAPQTTPSPGTYTDTVTVTVTY